MFVNKLAIICLSPQINSCIEMENIDKCFSYHYINRNNAILLLIGPLDDIPNRYSFDPSKQIRGPPESP